MVAADAYLRPGGGEAAGTTARGAKGLSCSCAVAIVVGGRRRRTRTRTTELTIRCAHSQATMLTMRRLDAVRSALRSAQPTQFARPSFSGSGQPPRGEASTARSVYLVHTAFLWSPPSSSLQTWPMQSRYKRQELSIDQTRSEIDLSIDIHVPY